MRASGGESGESPQAECVRLYRTDTEAVADIVVGVYSHVTLPIPIAYVEIENVQECVP